MDTVAISAFTFQQTAEFFELAKKVYREGADSGSYAIVKTGWLMRGYAAGSEVTGKTTAGMTIKGKLLRSTGLFTSKLYIAYDVGSPQLPCRVGGLPAVHQDTAGCKWKPKSKTYNNVFIKKY